MLTADLVRASRRGDKLHVTALAGKQRVRAVELGEAYLEIALGHQGAPLHELRAAWAAVEVAPREVKLSAGLLKLCEDACEFEAESAVDPRKLRAEVFERSARLRREPAEGERFDREALLCSVGEPLGLSAEQVESALYADLKSEHRLMQPPALSAEALVARYEIGQLQAVLLRAVSVRAHVSCSSAAGYRDIFRKLKFRRLLFQIRADAAGGYHLDIDGPFSLFESVTKYGLQLAMMLPALMQADRLELHARLQWGKARQPCTFSLEKKRPSGADDGGVRLPDEVAALLTAFSEGRSGWHARVADKVIDLPGVGLCVPDLRFDHADGSRVFLEVLGYWSREAVWKRLELVERGVGEKLIFAASQRLRVSEALLDGSESAALYVYKGSLAVKAIVERLERLRGA
jgi:predicted nuclease of restriction endonuclease-like RecB superfamily